MTVNINKTIAGIATPPGNSGVGIIRISGPNALQIASKIFSCNKQQTDSNLEVDQQSIFLVPRVATLGTVYGKNFNDLALAIYFKAPNSFTGEDTVELQCHGGWFLLQKVLAAAIGNGAVMAENGEFSRQAFLNGKISLDQAEAIIDTINAESDLQLNNANLILGGSLKQQLLEAEQSLIEITAQIEATIDYPEHDIEQTTVDIIRVSVTGLLKQIKELTDTAEQGRIVANGIKVALLGKTNVGKSSIFNALLKTERSIVTEIAGTTTDTITESINFNGIKIVFSDTAGIREGKNKIEKIGIERSRQAVNDCDVALAVFDASRLPDADDAQILDLIKHKPNILVLNKNDLIKDEKNLNVWKSLIKNFILTSAFNNQNTSEIKKQIYDKVITTPLSNHKIIITNARHLDELLKAQAALENILETLEEVPLDCIASDVNTALSHFGNITGTRASEAVLDEIFSRFCLGK